MSGLDPKPTAPSPVSSGLARDARQPGIVLVTGASSGIGWETTHLLARQNWTVFAASRTIHQKLAQVQLEPALRHKIHPIELDILDEKSCEAAVSTVLGHHGQTGCAGSLCR